VSLGGGSKRDGRELLLRGDKWDRLGLKRQRKGNGGDWIKGDVQKGKKKKNKSNICRRSKTLGNSRKSHCPGEVQRGHEREGYKKKKKDFKKYDHGKKRGGGGGSKKGE